jgi:hypothetical protein
MTILKPILLLAALAALAGTPLLSASAQTQPAPAPTTTPPPASKPETMPAPPAQKPAPVPGDRTTTAPKADPLVGLAVFSSDGSKLGNVQSVVSGPDGKATAVHIKTGGFLGLGGKLVAIPDGKFTKTGDRVQLSLTADEVSKLPEIKDKS